MSSGSQEKHAELRGEFAREFRQFTGLSASIFRAAAARTGMTVTDMQVIDLLESAGSMTAGQLADLIGLTTGAITGMLNRLEEAELVRRERDPDDARRVIVHLETSKDKTHDISPVIASIGKVWDEQALHYNDEQLAFLLEFLKRSNALARQEIARLREAPSGEGEVSSAPLGNLERARLVVSSGVYRFTVRAGDTMGALYQARFEGSPPDVKVKEGVVTIRYSRRLWTTLGGEKRAAEVTLNRAIPWQIAIQGGTSEIIARLGDLNLAGLVVKGGMSMIHLELPEPSGTVPIRIGGGASEIEVRRPAGIAARVHLKGWASTIVFDDQRFSDVGGNDVRLQSPGYEAAAVRYDIEVASSASMVTIASS